MYPNALEATPPADMPTLYQMLRDTSRTFALSIELLPKVVRDSITVAYLLLRVSDFLEDNEIMSAQQKAEMLELWEQVLAGEQPVGALTAQLQQADGSDPEVAVAQEAHLVLAGLHALPERIQEVINRYVRETSLGMAYWQRMGPIIGDEAEMDNYMHYVAGIVGYLITEVFAWYSPHIRERADELMPLSREYGLALQTVNVIRGMRKDYERGWVFVPRTFYQPLGLSAAELFEPQHSDKALEVVDKLATKAEAHLQHGVDYIMAFPRRQHRIRLACMWPLLFAAKTLAVSRHNQQVLQKEAKISRAQVRSIMQLTTAFGWSNTWLRWYYRHLSATE